MVRAPIPRSKTNVSEQHGKLSGEKTKPFSPVPKGTALWLCWRVGPSLRGLDGTTYLHEAARKVDNSRLIALLIESGIDPTARDRNGWTPLHFAANRGHRGNTEALLSAKADPNAESTKLWEDAEVDPEGAEYVRFRFQAGTRPLDVAGTGSARSPPTSDVLKKWGATKNPTVDNFQRRL